MMKIGIVGSGAMGSGIAQVAATAGHEVSGLVELPRLEGLYHLVHRPADPGNELDTGALYEVCDCIRDGPAYQYVGAELPYPPYLHRRDQAPEVMLLPIPSTAPLQAPDQYAACGVKEGRDPVVPYW